MGAFSKYIGGIVTLPLLLPGSLSAQTISGRILFTKDPALANKTVQVLQDGQLKERSFTDRNGYFNIALCDTGKCEIILDLENMRDTIDWSWGGEQMRRGVTYIANKRYYLLQGEPIICLIGSTVDFDLPGDRWYSREEIVNQN